MEELLAELLPSYAAAPPTHSNEDDPQGTQLPQLAQPFDICATYNKFLSDSEPNLPAALAAIRALTAALEIYPLNTVSETLSLLSVLSLTLEQSVPNPVEVGAGTEIFHRWLATTQHRPNALSSSSSIVEAEAVHLETLDAQAGFAATKTALIVAANRFVEKGLESRKRLANHGHKLIQDGTTVIIPCMSDVVNVVLEAAVTAKVDMRVVLVDNPHQTGMLDQRNETAINGQENINNTVTWLRRAGIPVATVCYQALAPTLLAIETPRFFNHKANAIVLAGVDALLSDGDILAPLGTYQAAALASGFNVDFYAVGESFRCVREDSSKLRKIHAAAGREMLVFEPSVPPHYTDGSASSSAGHKRYLKAVDITPANVITGIITESGVLCPSAIAEEAIRIWF